MNNYLIHGVGSRGKRWANHKYIRIENGRYIYKDPMDDKKNRTLKNIIDYKITGKGYERDFGKIDLNRRLRSAKAADDRYRTEAMLEAKYRNDHYRPTYNSMTKQDQKKADDAMSKYYSVNDSDDKEQNVANTALFKSFDAVIPKTKHAISNTAYDITETVKNLPETIKSIPETLRNKGKSAIGNFIRNASKW